MAVWKRYNGKRIKGEGPKGKGIWIVEFRLRGHYIKQAIPEARTKAEAEKVDSLILSSGKVYFELLARRRKAGKDNIALLRVEQLYPFPDLEIANELARYPNLKHVVWCQEESKNQGAWTFVMERMLDIVKTPGMLRYVGPEATASTAPGYASMHATRVESFLRAAIGDARE